MLPYDEWPEEYKETRDSIWELGQEFRDKRAAVMEELGVVEKEYVDKVIAIAEKCAERGHVWTPSRNYQESTRYTCVVCGTEVERDTDRPTYITFEMKAYWVKNPNLHVRYKK